MVAVNGYAKINLLLDILGQREDGYHEIATVMQSLALADTLTLTKQESGITLTVDLPGLEADERNLAYRAAALLMRECGVRGGCTARRERALCARTIRCRTLPSWSADRLGRTVLPDGRDGTCHGTRRGA